MASGDTLVSFVPTDNHPPNANAATPDYRNGHPVLDFDQATVEYANFKSCLPRFYSGGGITATIAWSASTATSGNAKWNVAIERIEDEGTDIDADSFATAQTATGAAPATSGAIQYTAVALTNAQIDGLLVGEWFRMQTSRDASHANDTMTGDAELVGVELRET